MLLAVALAGVVWVIARPRLAVDEPGSQASSGHALADPGGPAPTFERDVRPLLKVYCWDCHGGGGFKAKLDLRSLSQFVDRPGRKRVLVPGHADESLMYRRLANKTMPPAYIKDQPSDAEVDVIRRWIDHGDFADVRKTQPDEAEPPRWSSEDREWWAFRPPERHATPQVHNPARVRTPIDAFVLAKLEDEELGFSPDADRLTLIRRATFDLTGLPPSPGDVESFVDDPSPDAYPRLIDRLLASPHYGERWGRHWLDAAGYADTADDDHEADKLVTRDSIWRYRDYVVDAFNADLPYDRFLTEQIAGDELVDWRNPPVTDEKLRMLIATGFLRQAADVTNELPRNTAASRHQVLYDTVEVFCSNVLGLTVHCAQCHDHKFDPIAQIDYYRLLAVFQPAYNPQLWRTPQSRHMRLPQENGENLIVQALWDVGPPPPSYVYERGDLGRPANAVRPGAISILDDTEDAFAVSLREPQEVTSGYRTALARWVTKPDHPLTARVIVNRIWQQFFDRGIVETPANFGRSGSSPTHPELLDWLATEFVRCGYSFKHLHKLLLTSTVYRQATHVPLESRDGERFTDEHAAKAIEVDPENRLWWRMPLRRLESEIVRDRILAASGMLNDSLGGPPVPVKFDPDGSVEIDREQLESPNDACRRSLYLFARRNYPLSELAVFDQPLAKKNCLRRTDSAVVSQALAMLNGSLALESADRMGAQIRLLAGDDEDRRIQKAFEMALFREPTAEELQLSQQYLREQIRHFSQGPRADMPSAADAALSSLCHMLVNTNEFLYLE